MALQTGSSVSTINKTMYQHGPLVDDGAPYFGVELVELKVIACQLRLLETIKLEKIPESLIRYAHWQYGAGDHSSPTRKIMASIFLFVRSDSGTEIKITNPVLEGSLQWVIRRNITRKANLEHIGSNPISFIRGDVHHSLSSIYHAFFRYMRSQHSCNALKVVASRAQTAMFL